MTLLEECVEALKDNYTIVSEDEKNKILNKLENKYPFTKWGRIDWDKIIKKDEVDNILAVKEKLLNSNMEIYIIWDEVNLPIIKTDLFSVIDVIYDVTAVSFDTWLFSVDEKFIIEFYHEGEIKIGFSK